MTKESLTEEEPISPDETGVVARFWLAIARQWDFIAIVALAAILWLPRLCGPIDLRWDAGVYYLLGTSLAEGHGYRILSEPGSPEALQYPPLLPAVVAAAEWSFGSTNPDVVGPWLRKLYFLIFVAYGLAVLALARRYLSTTLALAAVAISLLQVNTLFFSDLLFTELPFALISVVFVLVALSPALNQRPVWREISGVSLAAAGFLLRTAGLALLVAWVLEALSRRHWRLALLRGLLGLLPVLLWQAHVARVRGSYEYAHPAYEYQRAPYQFYNVSYAENVIQGTSSGGSPARSRLASILVRSARNVAIVGKRLGEAVSSSEGYWRGFLSESQQLLLGRQIIPPGVVLLPILGLSVVVIAGVGVLALQRARLIVLVLLTSIGLICTTPWPSQFQRYLMPITSFLVIAALVGVSELGKFWSDSTHRLRIRLLQKVILATVVVLPLVVEIYAAIQVFAVRAREGATFVPGRGAVGPRFFYHDRLWIGWEQAIAWIERHSAPDSIIATPASHLCYLRTGRHAVSPPIDPDPSRASDLLKSVPVSYVIVDRDYKLPAVEQDGAGWHLIQSFDGTKLYGRQVGTNQ